MRHSTTVKFLRTGIIVLMMPILPVAIIGSMGELLAAIANFMAFYMLLPGIYWMDSLIYDFQYLNGR